MKTLLFPHGRDSIAISFAALLLPALAAHGQWTVTGYPVPLYVASIVFAGSGNQPAGYGVSGAGQSAAILWNTPASASVILNPPLSVDGAVYGAAGGSPGGQQVGDTVPLGFFTGHAALWSGTPESFVDLHPLGAVTSSARATTGAIQAGWADFGTHSQACLWTGTAATWTDLGPVGSDASVANAAAGSRQAGKAVFDGHDHAGIWSGSSGSWIDLNPPGSNDSEIFAMSPTLQAGRVYPQGAGNAHAALWSGTVSSFVDLHPAGASSSEVRGVLDGPPGIGRIQVGSATFADTTAIMWSGTAASAVNLNAFLTPPYSAASAWCVWSSATTLYIGGIARNDNSGSSEAIIWSRPLPPPPACPQDFDGNGSVAVADIFAFLSAWFAQQPAANFNHLAGIDVQDIFDFLTAWFAGCP